MLGCPFKNQRQRLARQLTQQNFQPAYVELEGNLKKMLVVGLNGSCHAAQQSQAKANFRGRNRKVGAGETALSGYAA
jgi:hypothetical protein